MRFVCISTKKNAWTGKEFSFRRGVGRLLLTASFLVVSGTAISDSSTMMQPLDSTERSALMPSRALLKQGQAAAEATCASCHGIDGISTAPGTPHLSGQRAVYLYRVLNAYQDRSRRNDVMNHAIGFLNDQALLAVSAYYSGLHPERPALPDAPERDPGSADAFASLHPDMKLCIRCHGEDGNASASGMPNLTAQSSAYFVTSMLSYANGERDHRMMAKLAKNLDSETLHLMGVFYAVQEPLRSEVTGEGNPDIGRELAADCANCHGDDGNITNADMPTLAGQDARYFIKAMQAYKDGTRPHEAMFKAVGALGEDDMANLAAFYASQQPVRRDERAPLTTAEWLDRCERCHGIDGNSSDPRIPMLAGQDATYLENALQAYIGKSRSNSAMHAMSDPLNENDIEHIVSYYSTRKPKSVLYLQVPCEDGESDGQ